MRLLHEQLRAGALTSHRIALAAYADDPAARHVLGEQAPREVDSIKEWVCGFDDWGRETTVRAAIGLGRRVLTEWERNAGWEVSGEDGELRIANRADATFTAALEAALAPRRAVEAAEAWVGCPCPQHRAAAEEYSWGSSPDATHASCLAVARAMITVDFAVQAVVDASELLAEEIIREAMRDAVVPWALGFGDPVAQVARLPRPTPVLDEWVERGWECNWSRSDDAVRLEVIVGAGSCSASVPAGPSSAMWQTRSGFRVARKQAEALIHEVDLRLWRERRWLPPGLHGHGFTRTLRVERAEDEPITRRWRM